MHAHTQISQYEILILFILASLLDIKQPTIKLCKGDTFHALYLIGISKQGD